MKMGCVVREPLHCFAAQPREIAIFEGEPFASIEHATQGLRGLSDPEQIKHAVRTNAIFITHNIRDFYWLHRWWKTLQVWDLLIQPHTGILAVPNSLRLDAAALAIIAFVSQVPIPQIENNLYVFKQNQWIREKW
jgi:hypothetical protein